MADGRHDANRQAQGQGEEIGEASRTVTANALPISRATLLFWVYDVPKSPLTMLENQVAYCSGTGLSRPIVCLTCSIVCSSAMSPIMVRTGSPGTMLRTKNVMAEMQITTPTACRILFTRKSLIRPLPSSWSRATRRIPP